MTTQRAATTRATAPRFKFFGDTIAELKKVVWLSRREALYLTALVLAITIVAGIVLGLLDLGFSRLVDVILRGS